MYLIYTACNRLRLSTDIKSLLTYLLIFPPSLALSPLILFHLGDYDLGEGLVGTRDTLILNMLGAL